MVAFMVAILRMTCTVFFIAPSGADGDSDDDGRADQSSFTLPGLEAGFEGAFHGFTEGHPPPPSSSTAHPLHTSFQGVGPMGEAHFVVC